MTVDIKEILDPYLTELFSAWDLPGLAVGIVKDDTIFYKKCLGMKNIDTKQPITPNSLFHCASISKTFVSIAIFILIERGKLDLNGLVLDYLPYFKISDSRFREITLKQLLSHTSGMPDTDDFQWDNPSFDELALERYVKSLEKEDLQLVSPPGEKYSYSNIAYEVLGDIIAKTSGISFEDFVKKEILIPLDMKNSTFLKTEVNPEYATSPHDRDLVTKISPIYPYNRAHAPSSTLHSSINDLSNWLIFNLNKGEFKNKRLLSSKIYDIIWKAIASTGRDSKSASMGCGWFLGEYKGEKTVLHGGADDGYAGSTILLPEKKIGLTILSNNHPAYVPRITLENAILDSMLHGKVPEIKVPLCFALSKKIHEKGIEKAIEFYKKIREEGFDGYLAGNDHLELVSEKLMGLKREKEAKKIIELVD